GSKRRNKRNLQRQRRLDKSKIRVI
ncbi:uncharacterized protein METZ01_LOCUS211825, partial [marine metagenome]